MDGEDKKRGILVAPMSKNTRPNSPDDLVVFETTFHVQRSMMIPSVIGMGRACEEDLFVRLA